MFKTARLLVILAALAALAVVSNPSAERHREKVASAIAESSPLAKVLGVGKLTAFVANYKSLGVASYTTVNERTVSVGAFGVVIVLQ